jgi:hypothetical protein
MLQPSSAKACASQVSHLPALGLLVFCPLHALPAEITVCFTPEYGMTPSCTQEVVDALTSAKESILVQA